MLRRYAITNTVYQPRQRDVVSLSLISNNQSLSYLHLILRWAAGTEIKAQHVVRETHQPVSHLIGETLHRNRVVLTHHYPAWLAGSPFKCTAMVSIGPTVAFIN
ncbi:hypothetical protein ASV36_04015 [Enterobacter hormaechei subsp. steigerwaltii]|nr:hypothetical protein ASV36_04015 [Enterobacter hormaechei subsp. steigerwaltii]KVJ96318.1 hypothetical protein AWS22_01180 [Enterobacter hormaechei subsp. steigerwaltii]KVJ96993.1 hypothetical protein AWS21_01310 [Enterobacter hormaechei subsp. steigerwaltii]